MNSIKFYLILLVTLTLQSCQKKSIMVNHRPEKSEITQIEWSNFGGMLGYHETVTITKDSILRTVLIGAQNNKTTNYKYKNSAKDWQELTNSVNLKDFKKIKSGSSNQPVDGSDEEILIKTKTSKDSIINGYDDKINYPKLEKFMKNLNKIRTEKFTN